MNHPALPETPIKKEWRVYSQGKIFMGITINSLWVGSDLSTLERLSIQSHLKQGHEYHLWTYEHLDAPQGVIVKDANEILPKTDIFTYSGAKKDGGGSVSAFSNIFRYKLLLEHGGWWSDTDVVCLKPFDFKQEYVIASEQSRPWRDDGPITATCVIKVPPKSELIKYCLDQSLILGQNVKWGQIGPRMLSEAVQVNHFSSAIVPSWVFCPVDWFSFADLFKPYPIAKLNPLTESYSVHLWNEMWRRENIDKDRKFQEGCLFERLKSAIL